MRRAPGSCWQHDPGARLIHDAKAELRPSFRPRRDPPPVSGEGVLMPYSSRPTNQCKGRSEPIAENSSDAPPRFGPLAPEVRARRLAQLRSALTGAAPRFQARIRAGEQGGLTP